MINAENEIFTDLATLLRTTYPGIYVTGERINIPPSFPCVSIVEISNAVYRNSSTNCVMENHAAVTYEVNVYSNKKSGKKAECKAIIGTIDERLAQLNFTRRMLEPIPNMEDATIYRMLGRYRAVIGTDKTIYRR